MRKWLIILSSGITAFLVLLILSCYYLLSTQSGAIFLASQAQKQLGGTLVIGEIRGKILDRLELDDILFSSPDTGEIRLKHLILDWKSSDLLHLNFHILKLSASGVSYAPPKQEEKKKKPKSNVPIILPDLVLPITVEIDKLAITDFSIISKTNQSSLLLHSAILSLYWDTTGISLQQLTLQAKDGTLSLRGDLKPQGSYPIHLTSSLSSKGPDLPNLEVRGSYSGDINTLDIRQNITGDALATLHLNLKDLLGELGWNVNLAIEQLRPALLAPDIPGLLKGKIAAKGSLHDASATADLQIRAIKFPLYNWDAVLDLDANLDTLALDIKKLILRRPDTSTRVELSGLAALNETSDLSLHWTDIQWPLTGPAQYASSAGTLKLSGRVDNYSLELQKGYFSGSMLPAGQLGIISHGNRKGASNLTIQADLLNGSTTLQGNIQWAPFFKWQLISTAMDINPGEKYARWPGRLQWNIKSRGSLAEEQFNAEIEIDSLKGSLRDLPLAGTGKIMMKDKNILMDSVTLSSADSVFTADGTLGDASNLDWTLNISNFSDLLPGGSGTLHAGGSVRGMMQKPHLKLQLLASNVGFQDLALQKLTTEANLDFRQDAFSVKLQGTGLHSGQNLIPNIELLGNGSRESHAIKIRVEHELAALSMDFTGNYGKDSWQGMVDRIDIRSKEIGNWQLQQAAALQASSKGASLQELCLKRANSDLCLAGSWDAKSSSSAGAVSISDLPLQWLAPWFPESVDELGGLFSAKATARMHDTLQANLTAVITPGIIKYSAVQRSGSVPHQGMQLDLQILKNALDANISLAIDSNSVQAFFHSPDILPLATSGNAALNGNIRVNAGKFDLVEILVPAVQNLDAAINIDLGISGTLQNPMVNGTGIVTIPNIFIPPAGLELKNSSIDLQCKNTELRLKGKLNSPQGSMDLNGMVTLDSSQNFPLQLSLKSDNFPLINLPEMRISLSSDLLLKRDGKVTSLLGEVTIPRAEVLLRQLPAGSQSVSPDVVIIQDVKEKKEATAPVHMDIQATLGRDVHFSGFGLNAFINGQLNILSEPGEQMMGSGSFSIDQGSFRAYGQDLDIETGIISFPGGPITQPGINLRATRTIGDVVAGIYAIGPARKPRITTFSKPPMPESQIISYLLTGSAPGESGKGAKLSIGRQINNKLSVSMGTDVKTGDSEFVTRYRLNRNIHIQTTTGGKGNAADIFYTVELGGEKQEQ